MANLTDSGGASVAPCLLSIPCPFQPSLCMSVLRLIFPCRLCHFEDAEEPGPPNLPCPLHACPGSLVSMSRSRIRQLAVKCQGLHSPFTDSFLSLVASERLQMPIWPIPCLGYLPSQASTPFCNGEALLQPSFHFKSIINTPMKQRFARNKSPSNRQS